METTRIAAQIANMVKTNRIPHAVLIEGNSIDVRDNSAMYLAAAMMCRSENKPCRLCRDCKKIFQGIHPDISVLGDDPKKKLIKVDEIRQLRRDAFIKPNEAECRVFIIKNAENMNDEAQNALLKLLEEPPETVGLILCASSGSKLLSTVRSRVIKVNVDGEVGIKQGTHIQSDAREIIAAVAEKNAYRLLVALHRITSDRAAASMFFGDTKNGLMQALSVKCGKDTNEEIIQEAASRLTSEQLIKLCDWCDEAAEKMNANANRNAAAVWLSVKANRIIGI